MTRPHEGTGPGLAISRDLARGMAGDLSVRSEPGAGSTFIVDLRLVGCACGTTATRGHPTPPRQRPRAR
ncbi:MAG: hypothetical protein KY464_02995 [Gemmatimonadetes bacterium]|nr:hypothetical protein [Gemmatimonadota bacterium]